MMIRGIQAFSVRPAVASVRHRGDAQPGSERVRNDDGRKISQHNNHETKVRDHNDSRPVRGHDDHETRTREHNDSARVRGHEHHDHGHSRRVSTEQLITRLLEPETHGAPPSGETAMEVYATARQEFLGEIASSGAQSTVDAVRAEIDALVASGALSTEKVSEVQQLADAFAASVDQSVEAFSSTDGRLRHAIRDFRHSIRHAFGDLRQGLKEVLLREDPVIEDPVIDDPVTPPNPPGKPNGDPGIQQTGGAEVATLDVGAFLNKLGDAFHDASRTLRADLKDARKLFDAIDKGRIRVGHHGPSEMSDAFVSKLRDTFRALYPEPEVVVGNDKPGPGRYVDLTA